MKQVVENRQHLLDSYKHEDIKKAEGDNKTTLVVTASKEGAESLKKLLECIKEKGNVGHSFSIIVDPETKENNKTYDWDGDGGASIKSIVLKGFDSDQLTSFQKIEKSEENGQVPLFEDILSVIEKSLEPNPFDVLMGIEKAQTPGGPPAGKEHLTPKVITDKNGHRKTVYISKQEAQEGDKKGATESSGKVGHSITSKDGTKGEIIHSDEDGHVVEFQQDGGESHAHISHDQFEGGKEKGHFTHEEKNGDETPFDGNEGEKEKPKKEESKKEEPTEKKEEGFSEKELLEHTSDELKEMINECLQQFQDGNIDEETFDSKVGALHGAIKSKIAAEKETEKDKEEPAPEAKAKKEGGYSKDKTAFNEEVSESRKKHDAAEEGSPEREKHKKYLEGAKDHKEKHFSAENYKAIKNWAGEDIKNAHIDSVIEGLVEADYEDGQLMVHRGSTPEENSGNVDRVVETVMGDFREGLQHMDMSMEDVRDVIYGMVQAYNEEDQSFFSDYEKSQSNPLEKAFDILKLEETK